MDRDASEWVSRITDDVIKLTWGVPALLRGRTHVASGHVLSSGIDERGEVVARIGGEGSRSHDVRVRHDQYGLSSTCSCPIGGGCKHAVAALLAVRDSRAVATTTWESVVSAMMPPPATGGGRELGLEFSARGGEEDPNAILLRPLARTAQGWSRNRAAWSDLHSPYPDAGWEPRQLALLQQLLHLQGGHHPAGTATWLVLGELGPLVWPLLRRIEAAGVALLPGEGLRQVALAPEPGRLWMDAETQEDGSLRLTVDGTLGPFPDGGRRFLIGLPAHGVGELAPGGNLRLVQLEETPPEALRSLVPTPMDLRVPAEDVPRFRLLYLPTLAREGLLHTGEDLASLLPAPVLVLTLSHAERQSLRARWTFRYRSDDCSTDVPLDPGTGGASRDRGREEALIRRVAELLDRPALLAADGRLASRVELSGIAAARFATEDVPRLAAAGVVVEGDAVEEWFRRCDEPPRIVVEALETADRDWFDLHVEIRVAGRQVHLADIMMALAAGDDAMLLDDGTWFELTTPRFDRLRQLIEEARALHDPNADGELRISPYQVGLMADLEELAIEQRHSNRWRQRVRGLLAVAAAADVAVPNGLRAELRPYQREGLSWLARLWDAGLGGVLADDMGLGKTLQTIALLERARQRGDLDTHPVLVVAPASVVGTWAAEAARFAPELAVTTITATKARRGSRLADEVRGAHVVVTSYTLLRIEAEHYLALRWRGLVLDEAQYVKNPRSRTHQVVRDLQAPVTLVITGTPLENSLGDLWSMFALAAPGLFPHPASFAERYRRPVENDGDTAVLAELRARVRPFMLRRTKAQVVRELPPKIEQVVRVELPPAHRRAYEQRLTRERVRVLGMLDDLGRNKVAIFRALTRLRQLALDPRLVDPEAPPVTSVKIDALVDQLRELAEEGHRALVFSSFTSFLNLVREALVEEGIGHAHLDGRTRNRQERIQEFRDGTDPVFLISLKAGGVGLTLTEADYVFVLDPWWNPAAENQAVDRAHRIGQSRTVHVYRLVAGDTIEEKVLALQQRKRVLFDSVVDTGEFASGAITADDIRGLIE